MPYCDNTHALSLGATVAELGREKLENQLEAWGFEMHEQMSATSYFPTLGGIIDGEVGIVKPTPERYWNLKMVFNYILHHPVSSDMVRRLLGRAMVVLVLNRAGMAIFRAMYDFAGRDFQKQKLWESARRECRIFLGVLPLLVGDMRRVWSDNVTCTDASPEGFGICERSMNISRVSDIGRWQERWRFKRTPIDEWQPRQRALGLDPLRDLNTARGDPDAFEWADSFSRNDSFEEIPHDILDPHDWDVALNGKWKHTHEHITLKEARCLCLAVRRLSRTSRHRSKRHLILVDNLALAFSMGKGRSSNHGMLRVAQKIGALALAANLCLRIRWVPSELNVSDAPSRGASTPGYVKDGQVIQDRYVPSKTASSKKESRGLFMSQMGSQRAMKKATPMMKTPLARMREVRTVTSRKIEIDSEVGKKAQKGKLTLLERSSISSEQHGQYQHYLAKFKDFCKENKLRFPAKKDVDALLADYFDVLFLDNKTASEGEKTLAAVEFYYHGLKGCLSRSRKALRGWRKLMPPKSRLPLPKPVACGMAMRLLFLQEREMALALLLAFDLYLRPGETMGLKVKNLVAPVVGAGKQYQHFTLVVRDEEDEIPDKTGVFSNSLPLGNPETKAWLGKALQKMVKKRKAEDPLFNLDSEKFRKKFQQAGSWLGLPNLHTYQLRHGGASDDLGKGHRDHNGVKARGRWKTDSSVRRYAKFGKVQELMKKMPPWALQYCTRSMHKMEAVVMGRAPPLSA